MTGLDERLAALPPDKRARFERMLSEHEPAEDIFPLAVFQEGMWFLEQLRPGNPAYVSTSAVRIRGRLDTGLLRSALDEVVRRHEVLRTVFRLRDGKPVQAIRAGLRIDLPEKDLRGHDPALVDLDAWIRSSVLDAPFDLENGPLTRAALIRTADDERVLAVAFHHLVSDRTSLGIMLDELARVYEALEQGRRSPLPEPEIQYGDFAAWQQERAVDGTWDEHLAYWREHLAGAPAALELPSDRQRPDVQGFDGATHPFHLPAPLLDRLSALAGEHGATPYMALLAVYAVLLHRLSGQDDIVVGVPTTARDRPETESLIGYFVNTLPVRIRLDGDPGFTDVLKRVRDACLGAYDHQDVPFDRVVTELGTARDLSRPPVYQASFSYGRDPVPGVGPGGTRLERLHVDGGGARFDLELQAFESGEGLSGWFEYDTGLFTEATVARFAHHYHRLAQEAVKSPGVCVGRLEMLGDTERRRILERSRGPERRWPRERGWIHQCVEDTARRTPDAAAVRFEGRDVGYAELNRRANRLAHRLIRLGVERDVLVGVAMERSIDLVVALLAVLKAGGAYVPLDPGYPRARLEHMLHDAAVPVLLTQSGLADLLPETDATVLCPDTEETLDREREDDPQVPVDGEDLAYVIYTSGSTGRPKGVMNVHAAIRNRLLWMQDAYRLDSTDRVLQKTPFSFDVSVWEFFWPLMVGATLVVARPEGHRDSGYLVDTVRSERITTLHFVPSMLQVFLREPVEDCASLRRVFCSGEALPPDLRDRFLQRSGAELHNLYGPTEAAVDVTAWDCRGDAAGVPVPIGVPIANTRILVLDRFGALVPEGVAGELHIGGRNLARGYLNLAGLTAERFVDDPFQEGVRLYRTGDLARTRADGALEFLGRLDHQVKLRGFRIELGEIEAALVEHPGVREAVVLARERGSGDTRLVAYVTADGAAAARASAPTAADLTAHLRRRLPEHMVPSAFEVLEALPLTPNGKVDRAALPEPRSDRPESAVRYTAPRRGLESALARTWCDLLGVDRVGADDNFFDLGGHSLLMAELKDRLAEEQGHRVTMVDLFRHPTVASLAEYLGGGDGALRGSAGAARERARRRNRDRRPAGSRTRSDSDR
ncbi:non-ribosomal peptide synthetase [Nocardiopsis dassonvillei]|uniref:non-ribosomal peptide synthetase n=1 Tax=Nocardiopsis dassonvillei TaxID=2014 RepID=UPI000B9D5CCF|nr:non-ribosomal peptide synthetase [Nocardiopsis dassonvillei]ASU58195.1 non-ribosomal peptide synthetase [Nocardiopsis dassonvillei]